MLLLLGFLIPADCLSDSFPPRITGLLSKLRRIPGRVRRFYLVSRKQADPLRRLGEDAGAPLIQVKVHSARGGL